DEIKKSKISGRDRCTIFGQTVLWVKKENQEISLKELMDFANELSEYVEKKKIARGFLYELLEIYNLYLSDAKKSQFLYLPRLIWQMERNIKDKDIREKLFLKFITSTESINWLKNIKIPVNYALLKSRR
ncbi:MAG: hypothetical protein NZ608_07495, partial [candidate division WOR-3 bacterium]|nr:hypothetical protein [candidate division WOR-3 bacterium]